MKSFLRMYNKGQAIAGIFPSYTCVDRQIKVDTRNGRVFEINLVDGSDTILDGFVEFTLERLSEILNSQIVSGDGFIFVIDDGMIKARAFDLE